MPSRPRDKVVGLPSPSEVPMNPLQMYRHLFGVVTMSDSISVLTVINHACSWGGLVGMLYSKLSHNKLYHLVYLVTTKWVYHELELPSGNVDKNQRQPTKIRNMAIAASSVGVAILSF